jgi:hypothetical protein
MYMYVANNAAIFCITLIQKWSRSESTVRATHDQILGQKNTSYFYKNISNKFLARLGYT